MNNKALEIYIGKWTYLAQKCEDMGYFRTGAIAREIQMNLDEIPQYTQTEEWKRRISSGVIDFESISEIAVNYTLCSACRFHGYGDIYKEDSACKECLFARSSGSCCASERYSIRSRTTIVPLFDEFNFSLERESEGKLYLFRDEVPEDYRKWGINY